MGSPSARISSSLLPMLLGQVDYCIPPLSDDERKCDSSSWLGMGVVQRRSEEYDESDGARLAASSRAASSCASEEEEIAGMWRGKEAEDIESDSEGSSVTEVAMRRERVNSFSSFSPFHEDGEEKDGTTTTSSGGGGNHERLFTRREEKNDEGEDDER